MKHSIIRKIFLVQLILSIPSGIYFLVLILNKTVVASAETFFYINKIINTLSYLCIFLFIMNVVLWVKNKFVDMHLFIINFLLYIFSIFTINNYRCSSHLSCWILVNLTGKQNWIYDALTLFQGLYQITRMLY